MLLEDPVLFPQAFDNLDLVAIHQTRKRDTQPDRVEHGQILRGRVVAHPSLRLG